MQRSIDSRTEKINKSEDSYDYGLALLRFIMCFEVVLCHFWESTEYSVVLKPFSMLRSFAVPVFMLMSFYLAQPGFEENRPGFLKKRLARLALPQLVWTFVYWAVLMTVDAVNGTDNIKGVRDLVCQLLSGSVPNVNGTMWYQVLLIVFTVFVFAIYRLAERKKPRTVCLVLIIMISLAMQYSGLNYRLFALPVAELRFTLGRIFEMLPLVAFGLLLRQEKAADRLAERRLLWAGLLLAATATIGVISARAYYAGSSFTAPGFGYSGIVRILGSAMILLAFILLFKTRLPEPLKTFIRRVSDYTLGIYCLHSLIGRGLAPLFQGFLETDGFLYCVIVYAVCYIASAAIARIPCKSACRLVK